MYAHFYFILYLRYCVVENITKTLPAIQIFNYNQIIIVYWKFPSSMRNVYSSVLYETFKTQIKYDYYNIHNNDFPTRWP